jgi:hypothetical protein
VEDVAVAAMARMLARIGRSIFETTLDALGCTKRGDAERERVFCWSILERER